MGRQGQFPTFKWLDLIAVFPTIYAVAGRNLVGDRDFCDIGSWSWFMFYDVMENLMIDKMELGEFYRELRIARGVEANEVTCEGTASQLSKFELGQSMSADKLFLPLKESYDICRVCI